MAQPFETPMYMYEFKNEATALEQATNYTPKRLLRWTFYAFMFSLPYDVLVPEWLPSWLHGELSIPRVTGVLLTLVFLLAVPNRRWQAPPAFRAFGAYLLVFAASMLRSGFWNFAVVFQQLQLIILFLIAYKLFLMRRMIRGALFSFSVSCALSSLLILTGTTVNPYQISVMEGRLSAFGASPNVFSFTLVIGVLSAVGIGYIRREKGVRFSPVSWAIVFVTIAGVLVSGSRGSTLALAIGIGALILQRKPLPSRVRQILIFAVIAAAALWAIGNDPVLMDRWEEFFITGNASGRSLIAARAIEMVKEKPIIGWGPAAENVLAVRLNYHWTTRGTHNMLLAMLTFNGILGALPYFYAYLLVFLASWRARTWVEGTLPIAIFAAIFVFDMANGQLPDKLHWTFFAYQLSAGELARIAALQKIKRNRRRLTFPPSRCKLLVGLI